MKHIASSYFYLRVSEELKRCTYILGEGVCWRNGNRRFSVYDLAARNLGLAAQEEWMQYPATAHKWNIDMPGEHFRPRFARLPLHIRLFMILLRPILWAITLIPSFRKSVLQTLIAGKGSRRNNDDESELDHLLLTERDKFIAENIERFFRQYGNCPQTTYAAIVFGAGHMPAICSALHKLGFRPGTRKWLEMILPPDDRQPNRAQP